MLCSSVQAFLLTAGALRIRDYLVDEVEDEAYGIAVYQHLRATRPAVADELLCLLYDVACYKTGDTCFAASAPPQEHDKWFVSVLAGSDLDQDIETIPLADTEEQAWSLAVEHLKLESRFLGQEATA